MTTSIARARADLEAGRYWKARDRLNGLIRDRPDRQVIELLATVHHAMHDLPAAGALWFVTGRQDEVAQLSIAAWRERHGNEEARWHSIPSPVRRTARLQHLKALEGAAREVAVERRSGSVSFGHLRTASRWEWVGSMAVGTFMICAIAMVVVGVWTTVEWIWP